MSPRRYALRFAAETPAATIIRAIEDAERQGWKPDTFKAMDLGGQLALSFTREAPEATP